jgi:DNA repair exonuclease SbcCD ATPase subunit
VIEFRRVVIDEFGPFEHAELDLYRRGLVLIKGDNRDTTAADSNAAGKTSIFRAIAWALFGDTIEGDKTDEVVRKGQKSCAVSVEWSDGEDLYRVQRARLGANPKFVLERNGQDISGAVVRDTQAEVHRLLGMDFRTFRNTVLYGQGDVNKFADPRTTDAERKAVLKKVLRLEVVDAAQKQMAERRKLVEKQRAALQQRRLVVEGRLGEVDPQRAKERLQELVAKSGEVEKKVRLKPKLERMTGEIAELLKTCETRHIEADKLRAVQRGIDIALSDRQAELRARGRELAGIAEQIGLFDAGRCPTCTTPATDRHVRQHVEDLKANVTVLLDEEKTIREAIREIEKEREQVAAKLCQIVADLADEKEWQRRHGEVLRELKAVERAARDLKELAGWADECRTEIKAAADKRKSLEDEMAGVDSKLADLDAEDEHVRFWCDGFGNGGLVSHILDGVIPELTARANEHLSVLSDGDIRVRFDTETALKSGEVRDKFDVIVDAEGLEAVRPSTGQLKKVTLAADLGLMDLVAARERAAVDLLLLDEVLDGLDASGRARVVDLLTELSRTKSSIFVVSHDPALEQLFEHVVVVTKERGVARLEA